MPPDRLWSPLGARLEGAGDGFRPTTVAGGSGGNAAWLQTKSMRKKDRAAAKKPSCGTVF